MLSVWLKMGHSWLRKLTAESVILSWTSCLNFTLIHFFFQVISMSRLRSFNPRWRKETSPMSKHSYETQSKKVSFVILTDSSSRWRFSLCQGLLNIIFFIHNSSLFAKNVNVFQGRRKGKFQSLCSFQWKPVESLPWTDNPSSESKYTIMTDRERIRKRSLLWH